MPKQSMTESSISRCCAVMHTMLSNSECFCSSSTSGAILIASGRVPKTDMTLMRLLIIDLLRRRFGSCGAAGLFGFGRYVFFRFGRFSVCPCVRCGLCFL